MISCTSPPEQKFSPAPVDDDGTDFRSRRKCAKQISQLGIGLEGERVLAFRAIQSHHADSAVPTPLEVARLEVLGLERLRLRLWDLSHIVLMCRAAR